MFLEVPQLHETSSALKTFGCVPAPRLYYFCETLHLKCLTVFWIRLCLDNSSVIYTLTLCYALHQIHSEFWHIQNSVYSGIFRHIQGYSALWRHIHAYWRIFKAYSGLFRHIHHPLQPLYIHNIVIFRALTYLQPEAYSELCETLTRHIQNPAIVRTFRTVFPGIIQPYSDIFRTLCNAYICRNLAYLESCNIQNPSLIASWVHFQNPVKFTKIGKPCVTLEIQNPGILTFLEYWQLWHIQNPTHMQNPLKAVRWSVVRKYLKPIIIFPKRSILNLWQGSEYAYLLTSTH